MARVFWYCKLPLMTRLGRRVRVGPFQYFTGPKANEMSWMIPVNSQRGQTIEANTSQFDLAFANQTSDPSTPGYNTSLILDIANSTATADFPAGHYGLSVPDLGDVYGATASVLAKNDYQEFGFQIDEGM